MRFTPIFLASLYFSSVSFAIADEPATTAVAVTKPPATNAPISATDAPSAPLTASSTASDTPAADTAAKTGPTDAQIKELRSNGYKMETSKTGQVLFCKNQAQIGTRFESKVCGSYEDIKHTTQNSKDFTDRMQANKYLSGGK